MHRRRTEPSYPAKHQPYAIFILRDITRMRLDIVTLSARVLSSGLEQGRV